MSLLSGIDCHVLYLPTDNRWWLSQAITSVQRAGVDPRLVEGVPGNIGAGRAKAYRTVPRGTKFVCHVDSDDWVGETWILDLRSAMRPEINGSYSDQTSVDEYGNPIPANPRTCYGERHLIRREAITNDLLAELDRTRRGSDILTYQWTSGWERVQTAAYYYRRRRPWPLRYPDAWAQHNRQIIERA